MAQPSVRTPLLQNIARRSAVLTRGRVSRNALIALGAAGLAMPGAAWAQCTLSGSTVNCTGTASSYSNTSNGITVNVASGASVQAPLAITGSGGILNNAGTISGSGSYATASFGNGANITNTGTITSTGSAAGSAAISVGTNSTVTEGAASGTAAGTLTAVTGTPAVTFGTNGTFVQTQVKV